MLLPLSLLLPSLACRPLSAAAWRGACDAFGEGQPRLLFYHTGEN